MPPKYEARIQTLKRAEYLEKLGYEVYIIGGSYLHNIGKNLIFDNSKFISLDYSGLKFIHIKTRDYNSNGISRWLNLIEFHFKIFLLAKKLPKPDIIGLIAAVPFSNIIYYVAKRLKALFIVDVVDLWPESFVAFDVISKKNPLLKCLYWSERWLYKKSDELVFSMEGGRDYLIEKSWDSENGGPIDLNHVHYINNGVDVDEFDRHKEEYEINDPDLLNRNTFKVVYIGSIRKANGLAQLIDAANLLKHIDKMKFLIYGDGDDRMHLEKFCKDQDLCNVVFKEKWIEIKYVPYILSKSDLNILNYMNSSIFRYGGSQSKSFQYMASGKPIISNIQMNYSPIEKFNIGITIRENTSKAYAEAIEKIYNLNPEEYDTICSNSRKAASLYDYEALTYDYHKIIEKRTGFFANH